MMLEPQHQHHVNNIAARLSLRTPQRESLNLLARLTEIIRLRKDINLTEALDVVQSEFPNVVDFDRDFPSFCFALATGVGKTRLMGAFAAYLHRAHEVRHFFVLAPNLTIYNKLIQDFTPGSPKYVFRGLDEFATTPPLLITGENYESSLAVRHEDLFGLDNRVHINVFNISKLNKDARSSRGATPRIKRLSEYIGQSYFEYLANLNDLVLMMDESHRYRAEAGVKVLNELRPVLGLELTATPQVETGSGTIPFNNVVYSYPLSNAIRDGFVKEAAVATRENFDPSHYSDASLERLKLEDGIRLHESVKAELDTYARQNELARVKPFMLVVAQDTAHADAIVQTVQDNDFFGGQYKDRIITVHSNQRGEEKEETIDRLLSVEDPNESTEIVVHVNMLKEGWDVTNLYTIVPLRAANSRTLVEQSIGRGLRLPYGRRTEVPEVDRLTIVSHDRFQEIIDAANDPNSIIRTGVVIGRDEPEISKRAVTVKPNFVQTVTEPVNSRENGRVPIPAEQHVINTTLDIIDKYSTRASSQILPNAEALQSSEVRSQITEEVHKVLRQADPAQLSLGGLNAPETAANVEELVDTTIKRVVDGTISIPRVVVVPKGVVKAGFHDFDLDPSSIRFQPVDQAVLIHHLQCSERYRLTTDAGVATEARLENYVVRHLIDYSDVDYGTHADLLYKLATQTIAHLSGYLPDQAAIENVLQYYGQRLAELIHTQMQIHFEAHASEYEATVTRGFETPKDLHFTADPNQPIHSVHQPVANPSNIRSMQFGNFKKCLYPIQKFESDTERQFAVILETDPDVIKWFRPVKGQLHIYFEHDRLYEPDFVVESTHRKYLCETKMRRDIETDEVQAKKHAAEEWCMQASNHEEEHNGKPWGYLLVPHDDVKQNYTLAGLVAKYAH